MSSRKRWSFNTGSLIAYFAILVLAFLPAVNAQTTSIQTLLQPSQSPLVTVRILVSTGSAFDPEGKAGLSSLTAAILAEGGSQRLSYDEIIKRMYPLATSFSAQVDK